MRICASCGRPLSEFDTACPHCGEGSAPVSGGAGAAYPGRSDLASRVAALYGLGAANDAPVESPALRGAEAQRKDAGRAAPETAAPRDDQPRTVYRAADDRAPLPAPEQSLSEPEKPVLKPESPVSEPEQDPAEADAAAAATEKALAALFADVTGEDAAPAEDAAPTRAEKRAAKKAQRDRRKAEQRAAEPESGEKLLRTGTIGRGGVIAILLASLAAVAAAVILIVAPLLEQQKQEAENAQLAYLQYLVGTWQSDSFVYTDSANPAREILTLGSDYSFSSVSWMSPNDRDAFDPDTWTECERLEGSFTIDLESAAVRFTYMKDGTNYVYNRYIRVLDGESLTLREYYNEKMTDYYDVVFQKTEG